MHKYQFLTISLVSVSAFSAGSVLAAPITFNFGASPTSSSSNSISYASNGFTLTIGQPSGSGTPVISAATNVDGTGNGLCVFSDYGANPSTNSSWCGQAKPTTLSSTTWSFTSPTGGVFRPISYALKGITTFPTNSLPANFTSTWTGTGGGFSNTRVVQTSDLGSTKPAITVNFGTGFDISSGSTFSLATIHNDPTTPLAYRIQSFTLEEVPGPLPVLGLSAAFVYSRKLRNRLKSSR